MDETIVTPESEKIDSTVTTTEESNVVVEDNSEAELQELIPTEEVKDKVSQETVPLSVFLALKDDMKELKKEIKEASSSKQSNVAMSGLKELTEKYPDVSEEFISDMLSSATSLAKKEALKEVEDRYTPIIEKQKQKEDLEKFNTAFDKVFNKALLDNPDLPKNIDKELIKTLIVTPQYKNTKIADILVKIYGGEVKGRDSSETETRTANSETETISNFGNMTPDQKRLVMADEKARNEYFKWLDMQN